MKHKQKHVFINKLVRRDRLERYINKCMVEYCSQQPFYDICESYFYKYYLEYIKTWTGTIPSTTNSDFWEMVISDCISTGYIYRFGNFRNIAEYYESNKPKKLESVRYTEWVKEIISDCIEYSTP